MGDFKWFLNLFENEILPGSHAPHPTAITEGPSHRQRRILLAKCLGSKLKQMTRPCSKQICQNLPWIYHMLWPIWDTLEQRKYTATRWDSQRNTSRQCSCLKEQRCHVNCDLSVTASDRCTHVVITFYCWSLLVVAGRCWLCLDSVWFATGAVSDYKFFLCGARWSIRGGRWVAVNAPRTNVAGSHWGQHWEILRAWISVEMVRSDMLGPLDSSGLQSLASYVEGSLGCMRLTCRSPCALLRVLVLRFGSWDGFDFWRFLVNGKMPKRVTFCFRSYLMAIRPPSAIVASICQVVSIVASCGIMWHPTIAFCTASQVAKSSEWHWPVLSMRIQSGAQICWGCYRFLPTGFTMFPSCSRHQGHLHFGRFNLSAVVT